ncbi:Protein POLR1D, isoform 2 [Triplophysa tibetana]|uniref:Protein POLR1D, isoform 2 n=1 Tax=Triplophysa tibetana TaxID=1572043 RepID=A0A5A9N6I3_9TELE|nr:Protein POLR1D, isoform 2 [Triplophysa tibetana]
MDDTELERKAVEELLKEANRGKLRAETMGPAGWMKCPLGSANKRFLLNTLGSSAVTPQSRNQGASDRGGNEHRYITCEKHHNKDCEECSDRRDNSHRRRHFNSHSRSSKHQSSARDDSAPRDHSPYISRRSNRTRSRSPFRDKKYSDRRKK